MGDYSNLEITLLAYVYQSVVSGRTTELNEMGVDVEDMRIIRQLPIMDLQRIRRGKLKAVKKIHLDRGVLKEMLTQAARASQQDQAVNRLIEAGAHHRMLSHFFGLTKQELSNRRKLLNVSLRGRRPLGAKKLHKKIDVMVVLDLVMQHIKCHKKQHRTIATHQCDALLATAEHTNIPVSVIWDAVDTAEQSGDFRWDG